VRNNSKEFKLIARILILLVYWRKIL